MMYLYVVIAIALCQAQSTEFVQEEGWAASTYDEDLATKLFYLTSASYCAHQKVIDWKCGAPCNHAKTVTDVTLFLNATKQIAGYTAYDTATKEIFVVFRGTEPYSVKNWMEDIDFIKFPYSYCHNGCEVHRGFYLAYTAIQDQVIGSVKAMITKYKNAPITVTGHSLGGALAQHAVAHLIDEGITITKLYTFGCPRVGDKNYFLWFNTIFNGPKFRVTHNRDPVPHLPFKSWGFHHLNTEAYYKDVLIFIHKSVKICNDATTEDPKCSDGNIIDANVFDHANYMGYNMEAGWVLCQ